MDKELWDLEKVADKFDLSLRTMRDYRRMSIIDPVKRMRNKDFYNPHEIIRATELMGDNSFKTLREIAEIIIDDRTLHRNKKSNKKQK